MDKSKLKAGSKRAITDEGDVPIKKMKTDTVGNDEEIKTVVKTREKAIDDNVKRPELNIASPKKFRLSEYTSKFQQDPSKDKRENFEYFYGKDSPFSHFHPAKFEVDGITYKFCEQYMMHQKAVLFKDGKHASEILNSTDPIKCKKLGRKVENFNKDVWNRKSMDIVKKGNIAKYSQNTDLKKKLFATFPKIMVEASPRDRIWGIGLGASNVKAHNRKTWRGGNKLGYCLSEVRNKLMKEEGILD